MPAEEHRFNWIYAIVDATRWCVTHELTNGESQTIVTFDDLHSRLCDWWQSRLQNLPHLRNQIHAIRSNYGTTIRAPLAPSIRYSLDLEAELWGHDVNLYLDRTNLQNQAHVEMFKFVHGFYIFEQGITNLLMALNHAMPTTHWATRQAWWSLLFGARQFQVGCPFPIVATANTNDFVNGRAEAGSHATCYSGANFNYVNRNHYLDVLRGAIKGTTRWLREVKPNVQSLAGFYDVVWHYSESFRYRDAAVSSYARQNPFFWNLGVRWVFGML